MAHLCAIGAPKMTKNDNPSGFSLRLPDDSSREAAAVELLRNVAHKILDETGDPQFVINCLFGAVITVSHDFGADPWQLQTAFRKMAEVVLPAYNQRDQMRRLLDEAGPKKAN